MSLAVAEIARSFGESCLKVRADMQVRSEAPEVLVLMQCGTNPQGALACVTELAALPGWWGLPAVKNGAVYIVDHAPFLRPGPRVVRVLLPYIITSGPSLSEYPCKLAGY